MPSKVGNNADIDSTIRSSRSFFLNSPKQVRDPVVQCIFSRASEFQGYIPHENFEPLQLVRYQVGEHFSLHHDALRPEGHTNANRRGSFLVYLKADGVSGGGTHLPYVKLADKFTPAQEADLCRIVRCEEGKLSDSKEGITVMPIEGSATFWPNLNEDGALIKEVIHAGEHLEAGVKFGMNIWSWTASQE
jgi:prolyl 4-hydroxylase